MRTRSLILLGLTLTFQSTLPAQEIFESAPTSFSSEFSIRYPIAVDVTGDDYPDVCWVIVPDEVLVVRSNNGTGHLGDLIEQSSIHASTIVFAGDFDGDQDNDLITFYSIDQTISFLANNGVGVFTEHLLPFRASSAAGPFEAVDFNGDQIPDLAFTVDGTIYWAAGIGDGSFSNQQPVGTGVRYEFGDLDGDSSADIIVRNDRDIQIYWSEEGAFTDSTTYPTTNYPNVLAMGDFDEDLDIDILPFGVSGVGMKVYWNQGERLFVEGLPLIQSTGYDGVTTGDFNNDGIVDVAELTNDIGGLYLHLSADGDALAVRTKAPGENTSFCSSADMNQDGTEEPISTNDGFNLHYVLTSGGELQAELPITESNESIISDLTSVVGDLDADGLDEFVCREPGSNSPLNIYQCNEANEWVLSETLALPLNVETFSPAISDLDSDDIAEILFVSEANEVLALTQTTPLQFVAPVVIAQDAGTAFLRAIDTNNDDRQDLISISSGSNQTIRTFVQDEEGAFGKPVVTAAPGLLGSRTAIGILNDDALPDIVGLSDNGDVLLLLGAGGGSFTLSTIGTITGIGYRIALCDVDSDQDEDLLIVTKVNVSRGVILTNDGEGGFLESERTFDVAEAYLPPNFPATLVVTDLDGDSIDDLVQLAESSITVSMGDGVGGFIFSSEHTSYGKCKYLAAVRANDDPAPDLLVASSESTPDGLGLVSFMNGLPTVARMETFQPRSLVVAFGNPVTDSALSVENYTISGTTSRATSINPASVDRLSPVRVRLYFDSSSFVEGETLTLELSPAITDISGNPFGLIPTVNQTVDFGATSFSSGWMVTE